MTIFIAACATALIVSFVCSLLEATLLSLDDIHLESKRREGSHYAAVWQNMKSRIDRPIAAILILNTVAHTGGATVAGSAFDEIWGDENILYFSILFTLAVLLGTEIIPKVIGVNFAERLAPGLAPVLSFMTLALTPVIALTEWVARPFKQKAGKRRMSLADLRTVTAMAKNERLIDAEEESIIINATKLRLITVAAVMVPRERMVFFDTRQPSLANFEIAASALHTRYPVSQDGTIEGISGYVNFKEVVAMMPSRREAQIEPFIRPLPRIPATANLNEALKSLLGKREHMALVEDDQHRTIGLLTLEDLLEEIIGDVTDEFDRHSEDILRVGARRWKIGGGAPLKEIMRQTTFRLDGSRDALTLSEWLHTQLGREPRVGDVIEHAGITFTVLQLRRHKVYRVLMETRPA
jgi:putative hemolysin